MQAVAQNTVIHSTNYFLKKQYSDSLLDVDPLCKDVFQTNALAIDLPDL